VVAGYTHVFMEWLFFVTKPSPLAAMSHSEQLAVLLVAPLPVVAIGFTLVLLLWLISLVLIPTALRIVVQRIGWAPSAALFAICAFILLDNFTYTLFTFGVGSTSGWLRRAYAALVLALFLLAWWRLDRMNNTAQTRPGSRPVAVLACSLVIVATGIAAWQYFSTPTVPAERESSQLSPDELPNIVLFAADGLEAVNMSAYGYLRPTTPTIERLAQDALVFENALHNGGHSTMSDASMLTGRLALKTSFIASNLQLTGVDAYQHLPGILRRLGYRSIYIGMRQYADPFTYNLRDGFDSASGRQITGDKLFSGAPRSIAVAYSSEIYFLAQMYWRVAERLLHAADIEPMVNPFLEVKKQSSDYGWSDEKRIVELLEYIREASAPFFVHAHLLGTHDPLRPQRRVYSKEGDLYGDDLYDDAILEFDGFVEQLVDTLEQSGELDKTLLIITSDHGRNWRHHRIPLIFRFPGRTDRGIVSNSVQLLDVAPTILDYLGVEIPQWMDGDSLLSSKPDRLRPIFSQTTQLKDKVRSLKSVAVTFCQRTFSLDIDSGTVKVGEIPGHTSPCPEVDRLDVDEMKTLLMELLRSNGYNEEYLQARGVPRELAWKSGMRERKVFATSVFNNTEFAGNPVRAQVISLDFVNTALIASQSLRTNFSLRAIACIKVTEASELTVAITSDDGSRVLIDGERVIDNWGSHGMVKKQASKELSVGVHEVAIEYYQGGGPAGLKIEGNLALPGGESVSIYDVIYSPEVSSSGCH
jgi:arylsulfatase A-like enzyme